MKETSANTRKFKSLKRKAQHSIRHSYEQYLTDIVNPTVDHGNKKLWSLIRAKRRDTTKREWRTRRPYNSL